MSTDIQAPAYFYGKMIASSKDQVKIDEISMNDSK